MTRLTGIWKELDSALPQSPNYDELAAVLAKFAWMRDEQMVEALPKQPVGNWTYWGPKLSSLLDKLSGQARTQAERIVKFISYMD